MSRHARSSDDDFFLPDLCNVRAVFAIVVSTQLLAFVLTLAGGDGEFWSRLSFTSLFAQWISLSGTGLLCTIRPWLQRLTRVLAVSFTFAVLVSVCALVSEIAYQGLSQLERGLWAVADAEHIGFVGRTTAIGAIVYALALRYLYVQHQWWRNVQNEAELRIQALQARIRPHFLFNSINTITSLIRSQPEVAEEALEDMADLFRVSLGKRKTLVPLSEELEICRRYARMEALRLGDRLEIYWDFAGVPLDALVPLLGLQPLLENAIYHGIENLPRGGVVRLGGEIRDEIITLWISNPIPNRRHPQRQGHRIAVDNTRQRLALAYGDKARLTLEEEDDEYRVWLRFPYLRADNTVTDQGA